MKYSRLLPRRCLCPYHHFNHCIERLVRLLVCNHPIMTNCIILINSGGADWYSNSGFRQRQRERGTREAEIEAAVNMTLATLRQNNNTNRVRDEQRNNGSGYVYSESYGVPLAATSHQVNNDDPPRYDNLFKV